MPLLYLPKSGDSIVAEMIEKISEVTIIEDDPTQKKGTRQVPAVNVTRMNARMIEEVVEGDETQEVPFYETYTGADVAVLLAYRDWQLLRGLPYPDGSVVNLPLPKSAEVEVEEVKA